MNPLFPSFLTFLMLNVEVAQAIETGNIQGVVLDEGEIEVPGAEVVLSGTELAGERRMTTPENGSFRFDGLSPGTYELNVTFKGATIARALVTVSLNTTTTVRIPAKMGGVSEEIEVVGYRPVIDVTAPSFGQNLSEAQIQNLPVGRTYQDVVETIPGVSGRIDTSEGGGGDGNPSVRGEGQYGNNYFIDGVSTRDPATKTFGQSVNFDAIQEIQVYTDGAPAEFGQFTGMVVNVVTKDGGDEHHGSAAVFYSQHAFFDKTYPILDLDTGKEEETTKARFNAANFAGTAGGPIVKEKLWYFTSLDLAYSTALPEGVEDDNAIITRSGDFIGKLTWFPTSAWTLRYIGGVGYSPRPGFDVSQFILPEAASDRTDWDQSHRITATLAPDDKNTLELRLGYLNTNIDVVPSSGDELAAAYQDELGALRGNAYNFDYNDRNRYGGGLTFTRYLDKFIGEHEIKIGADAYVLNSTRDLLNTGRVTDFEWVVDTNGDGVPEPADGASDVGTRYQASEGYPCKEADFSDCGVREHWTNVGPLSQRVFTYSFFAQDDWSPFERLTLNLGARVDMEDGRNNEGDRHPSQIVTEFNELVDDRTIGEYGPLVVVSPRLGFTLDPFGDGKSKVSGHYGVYADLAGNNLWEWGNNRSASGFVRYIRDASGEWAYSNTQDPVGAKLIYDEDLKPPRLQKANIGIEREVIKDLAIGIRGILSRTKNIPEDVHVDYDILNPPETNDGNDWYIMNSPIKERVYRALELTVNKTFDEVWQLYGAYTLSESFGHTPGQFELPPGGTSGSDGNAVGVYLDDLGEQEDREAFYENGNGWYLDALNGLGHYSVSDPEYYDEAGWFGYLPYDSRHLITLNGSYTAPFGSTFGLVYEFDSGHAWQKRTNTIYDPGTAFGQGRGTRRMPAVHYVDVRLAHQIGLGTEDRSLEATLDIFNLLGFAQSITYYETDAPGFGNTLYRQSPRSVRLGLKFRY